MTALTDDQRAKICATARSYLGVKWRGHGRDHHGIDCTGLVECAYIDAGMGVEPMPATYRGVDSKLLLATLLRYCVRVSPSAARPADIILYGVPWAAHLAILVDGAPLNAMHCPVGGKVVEARFDLKRGDIRGVYTWA